jgi:hypothetical protein
MRTSLITLLLISNICFGQKVEKKSNYIQFNFGNSTPVIGVNYLHGFGYSNKGKNIRHFEAGLGLGIKPFDYDYEDNGPTVALSHNFAYLFGTGKQFFAIGYNGIFAKKDGLFSNIGYYTPNPYVGLRFEGKKFVLNINYNGYIYREKTTIIKNENELFERISTKIITVPGIGLGWKF